MADGKIPHRLPVATMLPWIRERVKAETVEKFALRCGVSARRFDEILSGRAEYMSFQNIDKLLANEGSRSIIDFFPEYADDSFSKVGAAPCRGAVPKKVCSVEGCEKAHHSRGYCNQHYRKVKKGFACCLTSQQVRVSSFCQEVDNRPERKKQ